MIYRLRDGALGRTDLVGGSIAEIRGGTRLPGFHLHVDGSFEQAI